MKVLVGRKGSGCKLCACPKYTRGRSRLAGFRCVLCRHLPADHRTPKPAQPNQQGGHSAFATSISAPCTPVTSPTAASGATAVASRKSSDAGAVASSTATAQAQSESVAAAASSLLGPARPASAGQAISSSSLGPPKKGRPSLYDPPAHKRREKAVVIPKSFTGPDGEEYESREVYLRYKNRIRDTALSATITAVRSLPRPASRHSQLPSTTPVRTRTRPATSHARSTGRLSKTLPAPSSAGTASAGTLGGRPATGGAASRLSGTQPISPSKSVDGTAVRRHVSLASSHFSTPLQRKSPAFKFPQTERGKGVVKEGPGAGDYDPLGALTATQARAPPAFTMAPRLKTHLEMANTLAKRFNKKEPPGPCDYHIPGLVEEAKTRNRGFVMGKRFSTTPYEASPGPATVTLPSFLDEGALVNKGKSMGTRLKTFGEMADALGYSKPPGPGAHDLRTFVEENKAKGRGPTFRGRNRTAAEIANEETPAPGDHPVLGSIDEAIRDGKGVHILARPADLTEKYRPVSPGPAAYDIRPRVFEHTLPVVDRLSPVKTLKQLQAEKRLQQSAAAASSDVPSEDAGLDASRVL